MHIVEAKGILSAKNGMNLYRGCSHGCIYCDSRSGVYHMDHDFEDIEIKGNAIELLEAALKRKRSKCMLGTGSMTDPYIPIERKIGNVRKALELAERYGYGFSLITKHIYGMTLDGMGTEQIAAQLEREGILTPRAYWLKKGVKRPGKGKQQPPTKWNSSTVTKILSLQEYCGDILNFKTYSKSYKNKKRIENDRENWVVFKDVHEPIIDRAVWELVQQKRGKVRKRRTNEGEKNMFSGLLVCADCGNNLHFHFNQGNPEIRYFNCSNYKGNRGTCTSTHYVRVDFLKQVVLGEIKRLTKFASRYEDDFVKAVMGSTQQNVALNRKLKEKELAALQARDEELDGLFERIYEDNVSGKLSDDRFAKMSRRYEDEQKEISEKIKTLRAEMDKLSSKSVTADMFISTVRKYTRAKVLTPRMLNELIDHIEVHQAEKIDGIWEQHLVIHYNCVGAIFIPDVFPLPAPQVSVNTRKGVVVNYAPGQLAV
jgi:site-specific DNA recombinase